MIILSLIERNAAAMRRALLAAPEKAGAVEVRLDALPASALSNLPALFRGAARPIIATCRRPADHGHFKGSEAERCDLLWAAIRAGATYVDVEYGTPAANLAKRLEGSPSIGLIVSHHDWKGMPPDAAGLYRRMAKIKRARAVKIVGTARRPSDLVKVRDLLRKIDRATPPLITFCMGAEGTLSRIMALAWGSWATYASAGSGRESAPGQLSLPDLLGMYRIEEIDDETRLAGIVGTPLGHTLSPAIHNAGYRADGLNFRYVPLEITASTGLRELRDLARALRIRGFSVTAPYKIKMMRHLDVIEPAAKRIGAVNSVLWDGKRLVGLNTDASGGLSALREALADLGKTPEGLVVAIVGSGGAARALAHAVADAGSSVLVASRSLPAGRALAKAVKGRHVSLGRLSKERYDVLVNCTPLGMEGAGRQTDSIADSAIKGLLVYDVVYRPESTALLTKARARGIATLGGLEMLVRQAADQYALFTGRDAPLEEMRSAARLELRGGKTG